MDLFVVVGALSECLLLYMLLSPLGKEFAILNIGATCPLGMLAGILLWPGGPLAFSVGCGLAAVAVVACVTLGIRRFQARRSAAA